MRIKRFEARDMQEALKLVKQEFGPDAVILSANSIKNNRGIYRFLNRPGVEVTAAIDSNHELPQKQACANYDKVERETQPRTGFVNALSNPQKALKGFPGQLRMLKRRQGPVRFPESGHQSDSGELAAFHRCMLAHGVTSDLAMNLIKKARQTPLISDSSISEMKAGLVHILEGMGMHAAPIAAQKGRQTIAALTGATGVGKTTTIAKIAAVHALELKQKVALISLDDYRIAAIEQLRVYGRIIGVPIEMASSGNELKKKIKKLADADLILIDTPGMSQNDQRQINEIRKMFVKIRQVETHLVISATSKNEDIKDVIDEFSVIPIDKLIFTKIDETSTFGCVLNEMARTKIPVSYFNNGQGVPEDIESGSLERIINLILKTEDSKSSSWNGMIRKPVGLILDEQDGGRVARSCVSMGRSDIQHYPGI
jgi:flagellar biosynthesis protein FlhF